MLNHSSLSLASCKDYCQTFISLELLLTITMVILSYGLLVCKYFTGLVDCQTYIKVDLKDKACR